MSESVSRHLFSKAFPSKMEDRPSQSLKPATNRSGCQTEKRQMESTYETLVHPALTAADQKATKDHGKDSLCGGGAISFAAYKHRKNDCYKFFLIKNSVSLSSMKQFQTQIFLLQRRTIG